MIRQKKRKMEKENVDCIFNLKKLCRQFRILHWCNSKNTNWFMVNKKEELLSSSKEIVNEYNEYFNQLLNSESNVS